MTTYRLPIMVPRIDNQLRVDAPKVAGFFYPCIAAAGDIEHDEITLPHPSFGDRLPE